MPGYLDEDAAADLAAQDDLDADNERERTPPDELPPRPGPSSPRRQPKPSTSKPVSRQKPLSSAAPVPAPPEKDDEDAAVATVTLECPVCGRALETDNQGLNEHVDFCLSRGVIREAQTASLAATKPKPLSQGSASGGGEGAPMRHKGHKPPSRQGHSGKNGGHGEGLLRFRKKT